MASLAPERQARVDAPTGATEQGTVVPRPADTSLGHALTSVGSMIETVASARVDSLETQAATEATEALNKTTSYEQAALDDANNKFSKINAAASSKAISGTQRIVMMQREANRLTNKFPWMGDEIQEMMGDPNAALTDIAKAKQKALDKQEIDEKQDHRDLALKRGVITGFESAEEAEFKIRNMRSADQARADWARNSGAVIDANGKATADPRTLSVMTTNAYIKSTDLRSELSVILNKAHAAIARGEAGAQQGFKAAKSAWFAKAQQIRSTSKQFTVDGQVVDIHQVLRKDLGTVVEGEYAGLDALFKYVDSIDIMDDVAMGVASNLLQNSLMNPTEAGSSRVIAGVAAAKLGLGNNPQAVVNFTSSVQSGTLFDVEGNIKSYQTIDFSKVTNDDARTASQIVQNRLTRTDSVVSDPELVSSLTVKASKSKTQGDLNVVLNDVYQSIPEIKAANDPMLETTFVKKGYEAIKLNAVELEEQMSGIMSLVADDDLREIEWGIDSTGKINYTMGKDISSGSGEGFWAGTASLFQMSPIGLGLGAMNQSDIRNTANRLKDSINKQLVIMDSFNSPEEAREAVLSIVGIRTKGEEVSEGK